MTELALHDFLKSGKASDAIKILQECRDKKMYTVGNELGKLFRAIFPLQSDILMHCCYCAFEGKNFTLAHDLANEMRGMVLPDQILTTLSHIISLSILHLSDRYTEYNPDLVQKIVQRPSNPFPMITFTITTCKRYDLFEKTINSFLNCCTDVDKIDKWFCVDDNSSEEDRKKMQEKYPFFEFYFKTFAEKGHPQSMNIIRNKVTTPYIFHMEDDWKFVAKKNYLTLCLDVISQSDQIGQCLINKNYAETERDIKIIGGHQSRTNGGTRYFLHEYCVSQEDYEKLFKKHGQGPNCAYWKHFSFRPSLLKKHILDDLGAYDEKISHFEAEYSDRYVKAGYVSTFLDGIYSLHIGRLTSERFDETKANAYVLNGEKQLVGKEEAVAVNHVGLNMKTYVLNLDRRSDRWETFTKHEAPKCLGYKRFSAIDGSKLHPNDQLQRIFEGNDYNMREGMVGCAMSHIKMWIELINSHYESFCILEDDLDFVPEFREKFLHAYKNLPAEWDICFLGHHLWKKYKLPEYFDKEALPILEKWTTIESMKYSMGGTGGYIISKSGARKMLEFINHIGMTNGIDTMQQKAADLINVYYCKPHLIYSDCWTPETNADTDIQHNHKSLDLRRPGNAAKYPERLKKNGQYNIDDAIDTTLPAPFLIACSETTHVIEAIKTFSTPRAKFPFDYTDGGKMEDFAEIITKVCAFKNDVEFLEFTTRFCLNNPYRIAFPHEKIPVKELLAAYLEKFKSLHAIITGGDPVILLHVARWRKTDSKVFEDLLKLLQSYNPRNCIITVNGLDKSAADLPNLHRKYLDFPAHFADDTWEDADKIAFDQSNFRVKLIPLLKNAVAEL